jgi:hypothetical protein
MRSSQQSLLYGFLSLLCFLVIVTCFRQGTQMLDIFIIRTAEIPQKPPERLLADVERMKE